MLAKHLESQEHFDCPTCGSPNPVILNEPKWCESCDYGLLPPDEEYPDSIFQKEIKKLGRKHSMQLFQNLTEFRVHEPRQTLSKIAATVIAFSVHSVSIGSILCGIALFSFWPQSFAILGTLFFLIFGYISFPWKLGKWPKDNVLSPDSSVYKLTARISDQLSSRPIEGIVISDEFNASYTEIGWKKKRLITLGLPLLESLSNAEIVGLIAHEVAHGVNGDVKRGVVVVTAIHSLNEWYSLIAPVSWTEGADETPLGPLVMIPINAGRLVVAQVPRIMSIVLSRLMLRDSQEAEYLADMKAAKAAGTENVVSALTSLYRRQSSWSNSVRAAAISQKKINLFDTEFAELPLPSDREWSRLQMAEEKVGLSFDATHPPVSYRIKYLKMCSQFEPRIVLSNEEGRALRAELKTHHARISELAIDKYRTSIS